MVKLLHFSDAHIDIAAQGKRDPQTGLSIRVLDFLKALDTIVDTAINERVDLVIFSGDAYKDRTPVPTFQREWGKRIIRLSQAGIPTILLVGNHDVSPAVGRATAMHEFDTLSVPNVHVVGKPHLFTPEQLNNLPIQVIALPWIVRSGFLTSKQDETIDMKDIDTRIEEVISQIINNLINELDPELPTILTAHASVQGAVFGGERTIMLGNDMVLPISLVKRQELDYVALGHIHKAQNLNEDSHPPIVYSGSIERVDFGEVHDEKYFVIAEIEKGKTIVSWRQLEGRPFVDTNIDLRSNDRPSEINPKNEETMPGPQDIKNYLIEHLPDLMEVENAITRLTLVYPKGWENLIDDEWILTYYQSALDTHINRKPVATSRLRLGDDETIANFTPEELLEQYWLSNHLSKDEIDALQIIAKEIIRRRSIFERPTFGYNHIIEENIE